MDRYQQANGLEIPPTAPDANPKYPTGGNPGSAQPASQPGPWWFHMITEALRNVIVDAGLTPKHDDLTLLSKAVITPPKLANALKGISGIPLGVALPQTGKAADPGFWACAENALTPLPVDAASQFVAKMYDPATQADAPYYFKCRADLTRDANGDHFAMPSRRQIQGRYIVETGSNENAWWHLYNDGWGVQGGTPAKTGSAGNKTVTLPIPFANEDYNLSGIPEYSAATAVAGSAFGFGLTATSFQYYEYPEVAYQGFNWRAEGQTNAISTQQHGILQIKIS